MSLKEFIQKISAEDPCWTSRIGFNFGYDLVDDRDLGNVVTLEPHGDHQETFMGGLSEDSLEDNLWDEVDVC